MSSVALGSEAAFNSSVAVVVVTFGSVTWVAVSVESDAFLASPFVGAGSVVVVVVATAGGSDGTAAMTS